MIKLIRESDYQKRQKLPLKQLIERAFDEGNELEMMLTRWIVVPDDEYEAKESELRAEGVIE